MNFNLWLDHNTAPLIAWAGAFCTLGLYSILYRENKIYRLFEHLYLGLATGFLIAQAWTKVLLPLWWTPMWQKGQWWLIYGLIAGLFYYFIYFPKFRWLSRLVIGFFLGVTAGRAFQVFANDTWPQIVSSFKPLLPPPAFAETAGHKAIPALTPAGAVNNLLFMFILVCVMSYFFFSFDQKNVVVKRSARMGRWLLMFTFGAIFGATVMARLALLIDRVDFLLNDFGPHIGGPGIAFAVVLALIAVVLFLSYRNNRQQESEADRSDVEETGGTA